jgi:dolichol-phosphate mannosyltransferase
MRAMVIVPTYNERDNIELLLRGLLDCDPLIHIIVVDDNSPDGTGDVVDAWAAREPRVHAIHRAGKSGLGTAYIAGFTYALAQNADVVMTMDADFSHHPRYVPQLLAAIHHADLAIGSRYVRGGGTLNCPLRRKLLSRGANVVAKSLLGLHAKDCTAGFRCYRADVLRDVQYETIRSNGYSYLVEMLYAVQSRGYSVTEIPILFEDRRYGTSKISSNEINRAVHTVMRLFRNRLLHPFTHSVPSPTWSVNSEVVSESKSVQQPPAE